MSDCVFVATGSGIVCTICGRTLPVSTTAVRRACTGNAPRPSRQVAAPPTGPGTELAAILSAASAFPCTGCEIHAAQMDAWGPDGCRQNRSTIVGWLMTSALRAPWGEAIRTGNYLRHQPWFKTFDPFGSLVDEAILRAEVKQKGVSR